MRRLAVLVLVLAGCGAAEPEVAGCNQYCQQAGGYGGGDEGRPPEAFLTVDASAPVAVTGGAVPVTLTCKWTESCQGALLLSAGLEELGRADLAVDAGATATILVPLATELTEAVTAEVLADFGDPECPPDALRPCVTPADLRVTPPRS